MKNISTSSDESEVIWVSPYSYLRNKHLWEKCDNINYDEILDYAIKVSQLHKYGYLLATQDVLAMVNASDEIRKKDKGRSDKLLSAASELCQWLANNDPNKESESVHIINLAQIHKRQHALNEEVIVKLKALLSLDSVTNDIKAGIYLLLDDMIHFEELYRQLTDEEQSSMKDYPIWRFYTKGIEDGRKE